MVERVGFFSPSTYLLEHRIEYIQKGVEILKNWGYQTMPLSDKLINKWRSLRPTEERVEEINNLVSLGEYDYLIPTWGGKNSNDLLPYIDYELIRKTKSIFCGVSDTAVLMNAISWKAKIKTFHGPNVLGKLNQTKEKSLPFDGYEIPEKVYSNFRTINNGKCIGRIVGGSLGTFTIGLSGTDFMPKFNSIFFFFESASLDFFQIRQHLSKLYLCGFFDNVVGFLIGRLIKLEKGEIISLINLLKDFTSNKTPIIYSDDFGHGDYYNFCMPLGLKCKVDTNNDRKIQFIY